MTSPPREPTRAAARAATMVPPAAQHGETMYFGYRCEPLAAADQAALNGMQPVLATANAECRERGIRFVVAFIPVKWRVHRDYVELPPGSELTSWRASVLNTRLGEWSTANGIGFLDLTPPLSRAATANLVYFSDDAHRTAAGHACIASEVAQRLPQPLTVD